MIDTLYTNGCSWTAGSEVELSPEFLTFMQKNGWSRQNAADPFNWNLVDAAGNMVTTVDQHWDKFNWAGKLQQLVSTDNLITLVNQASGGGSNDRILRTTTEYVKSLPAKRRRSTLIVIGWTVADRSEIMVDQHWQRFNPVQQFSTTVDTRLLSDPARIRQYDQYQQHYVTTVFNDRQRIHNYFQTIYLLSNLLDHLKIPYYFFNALPAWWHAGAAEISFDVITEFASEVAWAESHKNIHNRHDSMFGYVHGNNLPVAEYGHPLSISHQAWASHLYDHLLLRNII